MFTIRYLYSILVSVFLLDKSPTAKRGKGQKWRIRLYLTLLKITEYQKWGFLLTVGDSLCCFCRTLLISFLFRSKFVLANSLASQLGTLCLLLLECIIYNIFYSTHFKSEILRSLLFLFSVDSQIYDTIALETPGFLYL